MRNEEGERERKREEKTREGVQGGRERGGTVICCG